MEKEGNVLSIERFGARDFSDYTEDVQMIPLARPIPELDADHIFLIRLGLYSDYKLRIDGDEIIFWENDRYLRVGFREDLWEPVLDSGKVVGYRHSGDYYYARKIT